MNKLRNLDTLLFCIRYQAKKHSSAITFVAICAIVWAIAASVVQVKIAERATTASDYIYLLENTLSDDVFLDDISETDLYNEYHKELGL